MTCVFEAGVIFPKGKRTGGEKAISKILDDTKTEHVPQFYIRTMTGRKVFIDEYVPSHRLAIENEGRLWHRFPNHVRTASLEELGIRVLRIPNDVVIKRPAYAKQLIMDTLSLPPLEPTVQSDNLENALVFNLE